MSQNSFSKTKMIIFNFGTKIFIIFIIQDGYEIIPIKFMYKKTIDPIDVPTKKT